MSIIIDGVLVAIGMIIGGCAGIVAAAMLKASGQKPPTPEREGIE